MDSVLELGPGNEFLRIIDLYMRVTDPGNVKIHFTGYWDYISLSLKECFVEIAVTRRTALTTEPRIYWGQAELHRKQRESAGSWAIDFDVRFLGKTTVPTYCVVKDSDLVADPETARMAKLFQAAAEKGRFTFYIFGRANYWNGRVFINPEQVNYIHWTKP